MKTCGIDLGTTNSCVYVVAEGDYVLIQDDQGNSTFPSVVFMSRDSQLIVGYAARNRLGENPGPVTAIKRKMGTNETVSLRGELKSPVEISAIILTYLKELAERKVGEPIGRAVITVPAYFNHVQRQQTDEAGKLAGFQEVTTILEPVAAALAYSLSQSKKTMRVFCYDLGGGTFDATVLEKDGQGGISVISFGGDAFLGGENFDSRLATHLLERLSEKGYSLKLDLENPEDISRYQALKFYAEQAKKDLSANLETSIVRQGIFQDHNGETVDLDLRITQDDLKKCTGDLIQKSIDESLETLKKKTIARESIDEVIMVGGMSRIPLIQQLLGEAFHSKPTVVDPDLIVARGAAIKASEVFGDSQTTETGFTLELQYDRQTDKEFVRISGKFNKVVENHIVFLLNETTELSQELTRTDRFTFDNVPLVRNFENVFTLSVEDPGEVIVIERPIRILHDPKFVSTLVSPGSVITKPISVWTVDGLEVLFPENTSLPTTVSWGLETTDQAGQILLPIWEGNREVARLEIENIPKEIRIGVAVEVDISVDSDYQIRAKAQVPTIKREVAAKFQIGPIDTKVITPQFVKTQLQKLELEAKEVAEGCSISSAVEIFGERFKLLRDEIQIELSEMEPQKAKLHEKLGEMAALIKFLPRPGGHFILKPSFEDFSESLQAIINNAMDSDNHRSRQVREQIEPLREKARKAWEQKDPIAWRRVNEHTYYLWKSLQSEKEVALGMAAWLVLIKIPELEKYDTGNASEKIDFIRSKAIDTYSRVDQDFMPPPEAISSLITFFHETVKPLAKSLGITSNDDPIAVDPSQMAGLLRKQKKGSQ